MSTNSSETQHDEAAGSDELLLEDFLSRRKVAELQVMWGFWQNGARRPARKQELLSPLVASLLDEQTVRARIKVLSTRPREVLLRLVRADGYRAGLPELVTEAGRALEPYEVEAAASALAKRGFVDVSREKNGSGRGHETYRIPSDLGDLIAGLLHEEKRGPKEVFSLTGFLAAIGPNRLRRVFARAGCQTPTGCDPEDPVAAVLGEHSGSELLARVEDEELAAALYRGCTKYGGAILRTQFQELLGDRAEPEPAELRELLETNGLGTMTNLGLGDYGVSLGGESVVLFYEVVERVLDEAREGEGPAHDRVAHARVDLLTDLQQFLHLVASSPLRVTQGRTIYRAAQHRILDAFIFSEDCLMEREGVFGIVYTLAFGLELVEVTDESRLKLTRKGEQWDSEDLTEKVRAIYGRFLEERLPEGKDFHVRRLRRTVAAELARAPRGTMLAIHDVPYRVRNDYLHTLEDAGVRELYRNRFQYTYSPPRETPEELRNDLKSYVVSRLYPLGVVDVAIEGDEPVGVRVTELGRRLILGERLPDAGDGDAGPERSEPQQPLVVNPDFEVILFPDGDVNEIAHRLDRFAARTKSDEVSHYRIARDGVERAVVRGMDAEEILDFLGAFSRVPVPQNVEYSIREWAARVCFASQTETVLLRTTTAEAMERLMTHDEVRRLLVDTISPTAVTLRSNITDWKVLEQLRALGVYFK